MSLDERLAVGFNDAATMIGMSRSFLRAAVNDPDPNRRLKTVRINRRRLIRTSDLRQWFDRVAVVEETDGKDHAAIAA